MIVLSPVLDAVAPGKCLQKEFLNIKTKASFKYSSGLHYELGVKKKYEQNKKKVTKKLFFFLTN